MLLFSLGKEKKSKAPKLFKHLLVSFRGRERLLCENPEEWVWVEDLDLTIKSCSWLSTVSLSLWASVSLLIQWRGWTIAFFGVCSSPIVYDLMYYSPLFFPCIPFSFSMCIPSLKEGDNILLLWRGQGQQECIIRQCLSLCWGHGEWQVFTAGTGKEVNLDWGGKDFLSSLEIWSDGSWKRSDSGYILWFLWNLYWHGNSFRRIP